MNTESAELTERLRIERLAVETLYRAFSEKNPDLVDTVLAPQWDDIPLAPNQGPGRKASSQSSAASARLFPMYILPSTT
ncbi:Uncharacterised protein [Raoultella terrigena]|uniref:Uncharacterized protein n=1 Tax=Raoultella terrigena TaxID=577 RepID=A0A7Z9CQL8_RAOTE|nr:Uncharacterised protein [Raoultella terrigena]